MSFICNGIWNGYSAPHSHEYSADARMCYTVPVEPPRSEFVFGSKANPNGPLSAYQHSYVVDLKGDGDHAKKLTYNQCSDYIRNLIRAKNAPKATFTPYIGAPVYQPPKRTAADNQKLAMIEALFATIPKGYYAVGDDPNRFESLTFIFFSRPTKGQYAGTMKFLRHVGNGMGYKHDEFAVRWPSKLWSFYDRRGQEFIENVLLKIAADPLTAGMTYSEHLKRCRRCNADLTDERSRYYGIGPDCEQLWPQVISEVDDRKGAYA